MAEVQVTATIRARDAREAADTFEARMEANGCDVVQLGDFEPVDGYADRWTAEAVIDDNGQPAAVFAR